MAKYVRSLNKEDSRFHVSEEPENVVSDAISDAKEVRKKALQNTKEKLKSAYEDVGVSVFGVMGQAGVIGKAGVSGIPGKYGGSVLRIIDSGDISDEFVPSRGVGTSNPTIVYNQFDNTYSINGKKYTAEFLEDLKNNVNAYHSVNVSEVIMGSAPANMNPIQTRGTCAANYVASGSVKLSDMLMPPKTGSVSEIISEEGAKVLRILAGLDEK